MRTIKIGGTDYPISVTWGKIKKTSRNFVKRENKVSAIIDQIENLKSSTLPEKEKLKRTERLDKKLNIISMEVENQAKYDYLILQIWAYLERGFIFKPFITMKRMANKIQIDELAPAEKTIADILTVEDREGKNSV